MFLDHMTNQWGYLLTNNEGFWTPYLGSCARSIAEKCSKKGCWFDPATFAIFGFIDNPVADHLKMIAMLHDMTH
jgi:hypothetical protein